MDLILAAYLTAQAQQPPCGETAKLESYLSTKYGEAPVGIGMGPQGQILSIFANEATGTFSVVVRRPDHQSCIVMAGTGFTSMQPAKQTPGSDL